MTTTYTQRLRPAAERMLTVKEEQLLQAGKRLPGDTQKRTFANQPKGYTGAAINPWRTGKRQVKSLYKVNGKLTWSDESHCSKKAKGYPATANVVDNNGDLSTERTKDERNNHALLQEQMMGLHKGEVKAKPANAYTYVQRGSEWVELPTAPQHEVEVQGTYSNKPATTWATQLDRPLPPMQADNLGQVPDRKPGQKRPLDMVQATPVQRIEGFEYGTDEQREAALAEQLATFGTLQRKAIPMDEAACIAKGKYERKEGVLDRTLERAFSPRTRTASDSHLTLDMRPIEDEEPSWTPATGDRMAELMEAEAKREWDQMLATVMGNLTEKQREAVDLTALGLPLTSSQRNNLQVAREKATKIAQTREAKARKAARKAARLAKKG